MTEPNGHKAERIIAQALREIITNVPKSIEDDANYIWGMLDAEGLITEPTPEAISKGDRLIEFSDYRDAPVGTVIHDMPNNDGLYCYTKQSDGKWAHDLSKDEPDTWRSSESLARAKGPRTVQKWGMG